jgi:hypothetical protein
VGQQHWLVLGHDQHFDPQLGLQEEGLQEQQVWEQQVWEQQVWEQVKALLVVLQVVAQYLQAPGHHVPAEASTMELQLHA